MTWKQHFGHDWSSMEDLGEDMGSLTHGIGERL